MSIKLKELVFSSTAKDTYISFLGNLFSAFWGFIFTLIVARKLSVSDFGVFSAVLNLVIILSSLADVGISTGSVKFIAENHTVGNKKKTDEYTKASFVIRTSIVIGLSLIVLMFPSFISNHLLATTDPTMAMWAAFVSVFIFPVMFFPNILQAKRKFLESAFLDNSYYLGRLFITFVFSYFGILTMQNAFWAFGVGFVVSIILTLVYVGKDFFYTKPSIDEYKNLMKFSWWIAVNRIISSISGRLDVQMLAALAGAVATGLYSIPSRLSSFLIVLAGSFSAVLAPRFASFNDKKKEWSYILKSTLALVPITFGIIIWIIFAKEFTVLLFGDKYIDSVPILKALLAAQIPFLFTVPSVTAIIYAMKKTVYIGAFSFFQIAAIFFLNVFFIPKYGPIGPTLTFGIVNIILAIYTWVIVIRYYLFSKEIASEPQLK